MRCKRELLLLALCCALTPLRSVFSSDQLKAYDILAIGVNEYASERMNPLNGCVNDAKAIASLFTGNAKDQVAQVLLDRNARKSQILSGLEKLAQSAAEQSSVVIYLSGHGFQRNQKWYFCPHDFDPSKPQTSGISGEELRVAFRPLQKKRCHVLVMIDACHAGEFVKQCEEDFRSLVDPQNGSLIVVGSCAPSQSSKDGSANGLFTEQLIRALGTGGDLDHIRHKLTGVPPSPTVQISLGEVRRSLAGFVRDATNKLPKLPGMARPEQEFLIDWSLSTSDAQVLTSYARNRFEISAGLQGLLSRPIDPPALSVAETDKSIAGEWVAAEPILLKVDASGNPVFALDATGKPLVRALVLAFDGKGNYRAISRLGSEAPVSTAGSYVFQPGKQFQLEYGNGQDKLGINSLSADELTIEFYPRLETTAEGYKEGPATLRFKRLPSE